MRSGWGQSGRLLRLGGVLLAGVVIVAGARHAARLGGPSPRSVILISIDTLRADHLSYAGYHRPTSPAIDRLARQSVDFRQAYSHSPSTLPSHASMFTSLYPSIHNAYAPGRIPLADGYTTLAERLLSNGFRTAAFVEGAQMAARWNLKQGFEIYYDPTDGEEFADYAPDRLVEILEQAGRWIEEHRQERFFCFIHSYVVHGPYWPRRPFQRMFDEGYTGSLPFHVEPPVCERLNQTWRHPDEPDVRHIVSLYDGEIRYMDQHLGRLLEKLTALGLDDRAVVVFTSDHGEEFAEHGRVGWHGHTLADELLHVPLLIRVPGMKAQVVERQVRLIDLAPTLLGLLKIDPGEGPMQGEDLLAGGAASGEDLPVLSERSSPIGWWASLRRPDRKIIGLEGKTFLLYDLANDPGEQQDVFDSGREGPRRLVDELRDTVARNKNWPSYPVSPVEMDPRAEARLRALGYIE